MKITRLAAIPLVGLTLATSADAATISIASVVAVDSPDYNLTTTYGTADWAYWSSTANPASGVPTNRKSGGSLISDMSVAGSVIGNLRGSTTTNNNPLYDFEFTDGTSPSSGTVSNLIGLFHSSLNVLGTGVQVNVLAPTAATFEIYLWGTQYLAATQLTATIGSETATNSDLGSSTNRSPGRMYTVMVTPDFIGQNVNLSFITTTAASNSHFSLAGVAVIPEPSGALFGGLGMLALLRRRRA